MWKEGFDFPNKTGKNKQDEQWYRQLRTIKPEDEINQTTAAWS